MEYTFGLGDDLHRVHVERDGDLYRVSVDGAAARLVRFVCDDEHTLRLMFADRQQRVHVVGDGDVRWAALGAEVFTLKLIPRGQAHGNARAAEDAGNLQAQMPGQVVSVAVKAGDEVVKGQTLVILEAMKMEVRVQAPHAGRVSRVLVVTGQVVARGQQLVEL